ncbi:MAG: hypothetical protein ACXW03_12680, partial [Methylobacter sp.]
GRSDAQRPRQMQAGRNTHRVQVRPPDVSQGGHCLHGQIFAPAISALTSTDGGNAARLPGAIAATTSLWIM